MSVNKIVVNGKEFSDATHWNNDPGMTLFSCNLFISNSLLGDELSVDTLNAQLNCSGYAYTYFRPKDSSCYVTADNELFCVRPRVVILAVDPTTYAYGQKVQYYRDNVLIATLYMNSVKRVGKYIFAISCISAIGLLDGELHYGGVYTGERVYQVLADIIGSRVEYSVDSAIKNMRVYGWLPVASLRENLQQLLFAEGGVAQSKADGTLDFKALQPGTASNVANSRIYSGGSIEYAGNVTKVAVTEHSYMSFFTDEEKTLFEGNITTEALTTPKGKAVQGILITFNEPIHDLKSVGAPLLESGANYAVLGNGISCALTGKAYTHSARVITRPDNISSRALTSVTDNTAVVDKATLVNLVNVESVAERVYAYYRASRTISSDIIVSSERPGKYVSLSDPFDDAAKGFVQSMDITVSQTLKANTKIVADYNPPIPGDFYANTTVLTTSQTWTVPSECKGRIRVVLGGGGQGGSSGGKGGDGTVTDISGPSNAFGGSMSGFGLGLGGTGGEPGEPGQGGKILQATLAVTPGQTFQVTIGAGGAGGAAGDKNPGRMGGNTTFGSYSSANGEIPGIGYIEQTSQTLYSAPGRTGIAGGQGSGGLRENMNDSNAHWIIPGDDITDLDGVTWHCGATKSGGQGEGEEENEGHLIIQREIANTSTTEGGRVRAISSYNAGSGPAAGSNGLDGDEIGTATAERTGYKGHYVLHGEAVGAPGVNGANATKYPKKQTIRGGGGDGGYGGGGAGGCALAAITRVSASDTSFDTSYTGGVLGTGGKGGKGGDGGDGYVIIYW